ncbi:MAG: hypothetical protein ING08_08130 [Roseomonas sp.]|nr:hypothetical protein [Roseomonas sp.]
MSDKELAAQLRGLGTHATHVAANRVDEQAAEIARLRAACDASEERERAIELRFWQTVDRDGLTGLPSDMWAALEQLVQDRAALATARQEGMEGFGDLVAAAYAESAKAMQKFPQPNYVISKIAEEAGEVVKAAIHCAEKRETAENVAAEMKQLIAMLIRLWVEGDQVHGLPPVSTAIRVAAKEDRQP